MALGLGSKKRLAIDWDRKDLRMVLVRPRAEGMDLIKAVSVPISPDVKFDDPESVGAFIARAMKEARVSNKTAVLAIPRDKVVINTLNLPPTPPEEMAAIVQFQIAKELPFAADQASVDFATNADFDPKTPSTVLVAAVRNEELAFYQKVVDAAGLVPQEIGLRPFANLIAVTTTTPQFAEKTLLIVEVGPYLTEIDIVRKGVLTFSRAASVVLPDLGAHSGERIEDSRIISQAVSDRGPDDLSRQAVSDLMVDIIRSFEAFRATDPSVSVDHIVVSGASGIEPQLTEALAARFAARAELYAPERGLEMTPQRARELRGFSAALGLALIHRREDMQDIDFLHPKKPVSKRAMQLKKLPVAIATAAMFVASLVTFHIKFIAPKEARVKAKQREVAAKQDLKKIVEEFGGKVIAVDEWKSSEQDWPEVLVALTEVFPPDQEAYLVRLDAETNPLRKGGRRESTIKMRFRTTTLGTVNVVSSKMTAAGFVDVIPGKEISSDTSTDAYHYDTAIDARLPDRQPPQADTTATEKPEPVAPKDKTPAKTTPPATSQPTGAVIPPVAPGKQPPAAPAKKNDSKESRHAA